ncbi:MAG TPA: hypothetical protein VGJ55_17570, partial [Pyrinomonadaceae bacterium]
MNSRLRYAASTLLGISIAAILLLGFPDVNSSRAKARAVVPAAELRTGTTAIAGEPVTLSPASLKTWGHYFRWAEEHWYCGAPSHAFEVNPEPEAIPGSIVAGYHHRYDPGAAVAGCPDGDSFAYRGTVWFDLSDIEKKAAALHVSVQSATLHFKPSGECPTELLYATADWLKGYPDNTLVPGDPAPIAKFGAWTSSFAPCPPEGCTVDVKTVVNNWLAGEEHGGYANYGFVFKGRQEGDSRFKETFACINRYQDFTLTVDYTSDKEMVKSVPDSYPLVCRGTYALKIMDFDGPVPFRWVGFNFIPGTGPAKNGLKAGQCSWLDRGMRADEPDRLAQPIEYTQVWNKELNSSDSYWTFNVYNAGDQLQATGAERSKNPGIDVAKPGDSIPGGDKLAVAKTNFALASRGAMANSSPI